MEVAAPARGHQEKDVVCDRAQVLPMSLETLCGMCVDANFRYRPNDRSLPSVNCTNPA